MVGARSSALSRVQVEEVYREILLFQPNIIFEKKYVNTMGDRDLKTSLRNLPKNDFFTYDVDELLLNGQIRIGIHSAKDLPEHISEGITVIAITRGVDSSDSLVLREGASLESLTADSKIATSSLRREEMVRMLRSDLSFVDIRGCIETRLACLDSKTVDGVVIAEAALIRLNEVHRNRIALIGDTVEGQGQLAITALDSDEIMKDLFSCIDVRSSAPCL